MSACQRFKHPLPTFTSFSFISTFISTLIFKFIFIFIWLFLFTPHANASEEFNVSYEITYKVKKDISVAVEQRISLTNKLANIYASQYQVSLGSTKIKDVWAQDSNGSLIPRVTKGENTTTIQVNFEEKVIGKDNTLTFTLGYVSEDYAMKNGRVLEIAIPKIAETEDLTSYNINLVIPAIFEDPAFILPTPTSITKAGSDNIYYFSQQAVQNKSITAAFGSYQVFNFDLSYHLNNKNSQEYYYEIVLPPDSPFQQVFYQTITPEPDTIEVDPDGNWLALYKLKPNEKLDVVATGSAKLFIKPQKNYDFNPDYNLQDYLGPKKYWETDNEQIKSLATKLKTAENIYNYLADNLIYDYAKVETNPERMGALSALENPSSAVCMEFTDLFIALARAAGIPAREVNGFAYTNNPKLRPLSLKQDVLHSWPQYYDQGRKLWINIDPTWGNTTAGIDYFNKLDLNHFAFVFHGLDSQFPLTPGSYKEFNDPGKDVNISFAQDVLAIKDLQVEINLPAQKMAGTSTKGTLVIKNKGNYALYNQKVKIWAPDFNMKEEQVNIPILPPFADFEQEVKLPKTKLLTKTSIPVFFEVAGQNYTHNIEINPLLPPKVNNIFARIINWFDNLFSKLKKQ